LILLYLKYKHNDNQRCKLKNYWSKPFIGLGVSNLTIGEALLQAKCMVLLSQLWGAFNLQSSHHQKNSCTFLVMFSGRRVFFIYINNSTCKKIVVNNLTNNATPQQQMFSIWVIILPIDLHMAICVHCWIFICIASLLFCTKYWVIQWGFQTTTRFMNVYFDKEIIKMNTFLFPCFENILNHVNKHFIQINNGENWFYIHESAWIHNCS
jgi:hypothetical protein